MTGAGRREMADKPLPDGEGGQGEWGVIGRAGERSSIADFLGLAGSAAALLLVGEAGIGKSTLWESGVAEAAARGLRVLVMRPAESEATLAFAGLGDLLEPVVDGALASLPAPQARARDRAAADRG